MPTVVVGTDAFLSLARATAAKHGLPHLPVATVPHPLGGVAGEAVAGRAPTVVNAVLRGLTTDAPAETTVTVFGAEAPHNVNDHGSTTADGLVMALAGTAATPGSNNIYLGGEPLVILGPEHAQTIAASGWSRDDFRRRFWARAQVPIAAFSAENLARFVAITPERFKDRTPEALVPWAPTPDDVSVIVAGGPGKHSAIVPTFGATRSVTVRAEDC